jgi:ABC-2 type transport system permease protein
MDKIWLIIKREYLTRVLKKSFLLFTLLTPLGIGLISFGAGYLASKGSKSAKKILVKDESSIVSVEDMKKDGSIYTLSSANIDELKKNYTQQGFDLLIHIPPYKDSSKVEHQISYYSKEKMGIGQLEDIEQSVEKSFKAYKINHSNIDKATLEKLDINIKMENALLTEKDKNIIGDKSSKFSSAIATGLSYIMGFLMYMVILVFGGMVMRSVMEEKINRIVEVMISSVKPFQLMLGKIIGVGLVGLTQLAIWLILIPIIMMVVTKFFGGDTSAVMANNPQMAGSAEALKKLQTENPEGIALLLKELKSMHWGLIIPAFVIYFFGGYFIYSAMFAAVGSAVGDDLGESQQMMLPLTLPVILAFVMIPAVFNNPDGPIAIFGSMFPLLSPILMPARLPFDPPVWQVILSIIFLILGMLGITWVAARIYRVGILMYGKKVSLKELGKWIFYKE